MHREQWAPIVEAPGYDVSADGRVRRRNNNDDDYYDVATWPNHKGYIMVSLEIAGAPRLRYVHRLMMTAFRGPDARRPIVNHEDGRKGHNELDNLAWSTAAANVSHARRLRVERQYGQRSLLALLS